MSGNLRDDGFRFILRDGEFIGWTHPAEVLPTDTDCTDMDDGEFAELVLATVKP